MFKLYKRVAGGIDYHEAWTIPGGVIEHWGRCGTRGDTQQHFADRGNDRKIMSAIYEKAMTDGFKAIPDEDLHLLLVRREVNGFGNSADLRQRHELEDYLNEALGWLGLGFCDGGSAGSGSIEVACFVVDFEIAAAALAPELANSPFSDFVLARED